MAFSFGASSTSSTGFSFGSSSLGSSGASSNNQNASFPSSPGRTWSCKTCKSRSWLREKEMDHCKLCGFCPLKEKAHMLWKLGVIEADDMVLLRAPLNFGTIEKPKVDARMDENEIYNVEVSGTTTSGVIFSPIKMTVTLTDQSGVRPDETIEIRDKATFTLTNVPPGYYTLTVFVEHFRLASPPATVEVVIAEPTPKHELSIENLIVDQLPSSCEYDKAYLVRLQPTDAEAQTVCNLFEATVRGKTIVGVYKSHCQSRVDAYQAKRDLFLKRFQGDSSRLNEYTVWHGTGAQTIAPICHQGFLRQFTTRAAYGCGCYFARDADYSARSNYATSDCRGFQYVFCCTILAGEFCRGQRDHKQPPVKDGTHVTFDSTVDNVQQPNMHIIYGDDQAIANFLVVFR